MIELFTDIPERIKSQAKFWVDQALNEPNILSGLKMINDYRDSCLNEEEKNFVDFYFNLRMEQILSNENTNN